MLMAKRIPYKPLTALTAGFAWSLAFSPWDFWPLVLISTALFWWSLQGADRRQSWWRGYLFGLGLFGAGVNWLYISIHVHGPTPLWLAIPMTAIFSAGMALYPGLLAWLWYRLGGHALTFLGLWVFTDWLRGWVLTGFPWLYGGYAMVDTPLASLAGLGGIWLLTMVTVASSLALVSISRPTKHKGVIALAVIGWITALWWTPDDSTAPSGEPINVALIQGNIPQDIKWLQTQSQATMEIYSNLSRQADDDALVIWPESAITEFYQDVIPFMLTERDRLAARGGTLLSGVPWRVSGEQGYHYYNTVAVVGTGSVYHKQKLVPFGEYVPLQSFIRGLIPFFNLPMSSFTRGDPEQPNLQAAGLTIAPFICYEILYPQLVAERSGDSDVLLTISNDAWFGTSAGPHQHFQMTRLRAIETGRWLVRATNNGITAIIDPQGKVVSQLPQFERDLLQGKVVPRSGQTPFQRTGSWPWILLSLLLVLAGWRLKPATSD